MANRGVNKVILLGNLGSDPDIRHLANGGGMAVSIRIATSESWLDQKSQTQERTEWHRVVFFRQLAEIASKHLKKGSRVYIEGSLHTQQWDKDGEKRYTTEVIARELQMLDRSGDAAGNSSRQNRSSQSGHRQNQNGTHRSGANHRGASSAKPAHTGNGLDDEYDDIPYF